LDGADGAGGTLVVPEFARPLAAQIELRMVELSDTLLAAEPGTEALRQAEKESLGTFEDVLSLALANYRPTPPTRSGIGRLVFHPLYATVVEANKTYVEGTSSRRAFLGSAMTALMAAETESLGPLRLTRVQTGKLAEVLTQVGDALKRLDMLTYAAEAYGRAARLHLDNDDNTARDRCLQLQASARHHAMPPGGRRFIQSLNHVLVGYGFAPYRMLAWMLAQLLVASAILAALPRHGKDNPGFLGTLYIALQDFVNPMGLGDTTGLSHWAWIVLVIESYLGLTCSSVFFALLLRKWFRI
jgi:hypothetical protein